MAIILNIDTTTLNCSISLNKDKKEAWLRQDKDAAGHAQNITLFIEGLVQEAGISLQEIDAVAVSKGPGSYTGLRIGISTAKGICYALDKPLIAIDTLQALAWAAQEEIKDGSKTAYVSMLDARRMDAYVAVYDEQLKEVVAPYFCTLAADSFEALLNQGFEQVVLAGDAVQKYLPLLKNDKIVPSSIDLPSAAYLSVLAEAAWQQKSFEDVAYFEPFYLKKPHITKPKPRF